MKQKIILIFLFVAAFSFLYAIKIRVTGQWTEIIDVNDLAGPPGSDLRPYQESSPAQVLIDVYQTNESWEVTVYKIDSLWHEDFRLYVRRTGNGQGSGDISGGLSYLEITSRERTFFWGSKVRRDVPLQFRLEGLSVNIPPQTYITNIIYTAIER